MPGTTYFVQECPTCGRNLQVRVEYMGKKVVCQHCSAGFDAVPPTKTGDTVDMSGSSLLDRAEELLQTAAASGIGLSSTSTRA